MNQPAPEKCQCTVWSKGRAYPCTYPAGHKGNCDPAGHGVLPVEPQGRKLSIDRPCSACSAGDTKMEHHLHYPPFRKMLPVEPQPAYTSAITDAHVAIAAALNHEPFQPLSQECRKSLQQALERLRMAVETVPVVPPACGKLPVGPGEPCYFPKGHAGRCSGLAATNETDNSETTQESGVVPQGAQQAKEAAFKMIMGRDGMPPDGDPYYDDDYAVHTEKEL